MYLGLKFLTTATGATPLNGRKDTELYEQNMQQSMSLGFTLQAHIKPYTSVGK